MVLVYPFGLLLLAAGASYVLHRVSRSRLRYWSLLMLQGLCISSPWVFTWESPFTRFGVALAALLAVVRIWEVRSNLCPPRARRSVRDFLSYFLMVPDIVFQCRQDASQRARKRGLGRIGRACLKGVALFGLFVLSTEYPELHRVWWAHTVWGLWAVYLSASGVVDVLAGAVMLVTGHDAHEVFVRPALARSPRDFWSRRWNMMFRNSAHRLIFLPLGGPKRPLIAVTAVFLWSALAHEYLVLAALGRSGGHMTVFFALHGAATLAEGAWKRRVPLPRPLAVALHLGWLIVTAPLFFAPLRAIVPAHTFRLW